MGASVRCPLPYQAQRNPQYSVHSMSPHIATTGALVCNSQQRQSTFQQDNRSYVAAGNQCGASAVNIQGNTFIIYKHADTACGCARVCAADARCKVWCDPAITCFSRSFQSLQKVKAASTLGFEMYAMLEWLAATAVPKGFKILTSALSRFCKTQKCRGIAILLLKLF